MFSIGASSGSLVPLAFQSVKTDPRMVPVPRARVAAALAAVPSPAGTRAVPVENVWTNRTVDRVVHGEPSVNSSGVRSAVMLNAIDEPRDRSPFNPTL